MGCLGAGVGGGSGEVMLVPGGVGWGQGPTGLREGAGQMDLRAKQMVQRLRVVGLGAKWLGPWARGQGGRCVPLSP